MTHPRRLIRQATADVLIAANTAAANRVWPSREPPVDVETVIIDQGPAILIYTRRDRSSESKDFSPQGYGWEKRECELYVEILAAGPAVVDDKLDDLAEQVEEIMDDLVIPSMQSAEIRYSETEIATTDEFAQPLGGALIRYIVCYWRQWRVDEEEDPLPCNTDVGVRVNGGSREIVLTRDCCADEDEP